MFIGYRHLIEKPESINLNNTRPFRPRVITDFTELNPSVKFTWSLTSFLSVTCRGSASNGIARETYINTIIHPSYKVNKPIPVQLTYIGTEVIGYIHELDLYSFGLNEFEVLKELNEDITDLLSVLIEEGSENLGRDPSKWLDTLNEYISRI